MGTHRWGVHLVFAVHPPPAYTYYIHGTWSVNHEDSLTYSAAVDLQFATRVRGCKVVRSACARDGGRCWARLISHMDGNYFTINLYIYFAACGRCGYVTTIYDNNYCVCNKTYNKTQKMQTKYEWVRWFSPFVFVLFALRCCGLHTERPQGVGCSAKCGHLSDLRFGVIDNEMKTMVSVMTEYSIQFLLHSVQYSIMMRTFSSSFFMYGHYNAMTAAIKAAKSTVKCLGILMTGCQPYKKKKPWQITLLWFCLRKKERKEKKMKLFLAMPYDKTRFWGGVGWVKKEKNMPNHRVNSFLAWQYGTRTGQIGESIFMPHKNC